MATLLLEHLANPWRVSACLDGYAQWLLLGGEASPESLGGSTQPTLFDDLASVCVDEAHR